MRIIILGAGGRLGALLTREYREKFDVVAFDHAQLDLANVGEIHHNIDELEFDVMINAAAMTNVDLCEKEIERAFAINAEAPQLLARICRDKQARLIHFSTDYVFDGEKREPYTETDVAKPISVYGESKRTGEKLVLQTQDRHLIVRVSWVFGPDRPSFVDAMIKRAREQDYLDAVADKFSTPTYTHDIAEALPRFFDGDVPGGILHFSNSGECSWQEYAQYALDCCISSGIQLSAKKVGALKLADMKNWISRRPVYSVLSSAKYAKLTGVTPRSWRDAVADYIERFHSKK
ncbi:MAG TPA: dTDP-4-dehydrorhamnose reductase [Chthoniobacterales bacterium]|nr:dTDP-4-dehydrorhamnose reductase [Chthoniobacterales bacterium]